MLIAIFNLNIPTYLNCINLAYIDVISSEGLKWPTFTNIQKVLLLFFSYQKPQPIKWIFLNTSLGRMIFIYNTVHTATASLQIKHTVLLLISIINRVVIYFIWNVTPSFKTLLFLLLDLEARKLASQSKIENIKHTAPNAVWLGDSWCSYSLLLLLRLFLLLLI